MTKKFLILFQDNLDSDSGPSSIIGLQSGPNYYWNVINHELDAIQLILPQREFDQILSWSTLCALMTSWPFTRQVPWFTIHIRYREIFFSRIEKMKGSQD